MQQLCERSCPAAREVHAVALEPLGVVRRVGLPVDDRDARRIGGGLVADRVVLNV
jgi:hypothetical protein